MRKNEPSKALDRFKIGKMGFPRPWMDPKSEKWAFQDLG